MNITLSSTSPWKMSAMYALVLDLALVTSMVGHSLARRPQISAEELFQKSTSLQSGSYAAAATTGEEASSNLIDGAGQSVAAAAAAKSSCYFNRDCHGREYCVKPDRGALTLGVCSPLSDMAPASRGAADHVRDLHFLVRSRRSVPVSSERRSRNDLLRQLLGEGSQLARALNSYLHAKYPAEWEKARVDRMVGKKSDAAAKDIDSAADTEDPDLLAILDKGSNRIVERLASGSLESWSNSKDDGRSATSGSEAEDRKNDVVVDVKENDMASGPKRRRMTRSPNSLR
ncbi:uncharacterized protein LOC119462109 [Dermacentor silvarum]|uniref:uncharacterized protein LOC119462109 n=1 Tax=Dermacentor silvarum TaxID=543639 RepID=UPI002101972A|nr:uncharacterized protein LOC119462109 [Dermacentor silvarum]